MRKLETVCIRGPVGCHLVVNEKNGEVVVTGNNCPRGAEYGRQELKNPKRTITTIFKLKNIASKRFIEPIEINMICNARF